MSNIKEQADIYNKKLNELNLIKTELKDESQKQGYTFNEQTGELTKLSDEVIVIDIYIDVKTINEDSGYYYTYAKLSEVPQTVFDKIKKYFTDQKEDWEFLLNEETELEKIEGMKKFFDFFCFFNCECVELEDIRWCDDKKDMQRKREGCLEYYGECNFTQNIDDQENVDGYITFFRMKRDIFERTKYERFFEHERYIADNKPYIYKLER